MTGSVLRVTARSPIFVDLDTPLDEESIGVVLVLENEIRRVLVVTEQSTVDVASRRDILTVLADAARAGRSW
jgi:hypothetical protein